MEYNNMADLKITNCALDVQNETVWTESGYNRARPNGRVS
jgi:hypothetical protein